MTPNVHTNALISSHFAFQPKWRRAETVTRSIEQEKQEANQKNNKFDVIIIRGKILT